MADPLDTSTPSDSDKVKFGAAEIRAVKALIHNKVGTVTPDVQLPLLTGQASKYVVVNPAETGLMFATPPNAAGTAGDLAAQLLTTTDPNKAAGQVAFNPAQSYPAGTVGDELRQILSGGLYSLINNNMLWNGELEKIDYTDSYPYTIFNNSRLLYGWAYAVTGSAIGNVAIDLHTLAPYPGYGETKFDPSFPRSYIRTHVTTAVAGAVTGACRIGAKLDWKAGYENLASPQGNNPAATAVSFKYRTNAAGTYAIALTMFDLNVPPPYFTARYITTVALIGDGKWHTTSFPVSAAVFASASPNTPRVQLQFEMIGADAYETTTPNTWEYSTISSPPLHTRVVGCQKTFLQTLGNYLDIAEAKVEVAPTGIPTPFAYRSHWTIRKDCEAREAAIRQSNPYGYAAGTTIYATMDALLGYPSQMIQPTALSYIKQITSPFSMKVVGPNGTPTTVSGWAAAGPGGAASLWTATITSGVLGATNCNWQLAYDSAPLQWFVDESGSGGNNILT